MFNSKVLFLTNIDFANIANIGIKKKVYQQVDALKLLGFKVDVLYKSGSIYFLLQNDGFKKELLESKIHLCFLKVIDKEPYNLLYIRHFLINLSFFRVLKNKKVSSKKWIKLMEIPTFPYHYEYLGMRNFKLIIKLYMNNFLCHNLNNRIDYIVTFSRRDLIYNIPTIKTDNGISPNVIKFYEHDKIKFNNTLNLIGLANVQIWHGYDRLIEGLKVYYNKANINTIVKFNIVGKGSALNQLKKLVNKYKLTPYVKFHGVLQGKELDELFTKQHFAIGSLGKHRVGIVNQQTSTIKSKEYAARGIPFILSHNDVDFPENYLYVLKASANEDSICISELIDFYISLKKNTKGYSNKLREYSEEKLSWFNKLKPIKTLVESHKV